MGTKEKGGPNIRFEDREGYLYSYVSGEKDSLAISIEYWHRVIEEAYKRESRRLLIEEDFPNQLTTVEIFTLIEAISKMLIAPLKMAFIDRRTEQNELNMFGETVAVNRGVYGKVFSDIGEAEKWLTS